MLKAEASMVTMATPASKAKKILPIIEPFMTLSSTLMALVVILTAAAKPIMAGMAPDSKPTLMALPMASRIFLSLSPSEAHDMKPCATDSTIGIIGPRKERRSCLPTAASESSVSPSFAPASTFSLDMISPRSSACLARASTSPLTELSVGMSSAAPRPKMSVARLDLTVPCSRRWNAATVSMRIWSCVFSAPDCVLMETPSRSSAEPPVVADFSMLSRSALKLTPML